MFQRKLLWTLVSQIPFSHLQIFVSKPVSFMNAFKYKYIQMFKTLFEMKRIQKKEYLDCLHLKTIWY